MLLLLVAGTIKPAMCVSTGRELLETCTLRTIFRLNSGRDQVIFVEWINKWWVITPGLYCSFHLCIVVADWLQTLFSLFTPPCTCSLQCDFPAFPIKRCNLFPHLLNLDWLFDLPWLTEYCGSVSMPAQDLGLQKPYLLPFSFLELFSWWEQAQASLLEDKCGRETNHVSREHSRLAIPSWPTNWPQDI